MKHTEVNIWAFSAISITLMQYNAKQYKNTLLTFEKEFGHRFSFPLMFKTHKNFSRLKKKHEKTQPSEEHTRARAQTHTHTRARTHAHACMQAHTRTHARARTHTHTHTHAHTCTHMHTHTHTHTHTQSHTPSITFRHLPPNSARFNYTTEGVLHISVQLSSDVISALWKVPVLIWL